MCCTAVGGPKERFFDSPSAFSVYLKRLVNPDRKADDGWKTVKYKDKCGAAPCCLCPSTVALSGACLRASAGLCCGILITRPRALASL